MPVAAIAGSDVAALRSRQERIQAIDILCEPAGTLPEQQVGAWLAVGVSDLAPLFDAGWSLEALLQTVQLLLQGVQVLAQAYQVKETPHFVVCHKPSESKTILLHTFSQATIDADLICIIEQELPAVGILASAQDYSAVLFAVMASTFPSPRNQQLIWRHFCLNTLARLRVLIAQPPLPLPPPVSHIVPFAAIYQRVMERLVGQSLLDIGSSFGLLPVLLAEKMVNVTLVGCDNNPDAISCSTDLAAVKHADQVTFLLRDVLAPDFPNVGHFDTVTAIHLLEHLTEQELAVAFTHLLQVTSRRLLIAVPYEEKVQPLYGHQQAFTQEKLHFWGNWCVETLGGTGRYWCEEVMGGLLIVNRSSEEK